VTSIGGLPVGPLEGRDRDQVIALVARAYAEYPGCVLDLSTVDADLDDLAADLAAADGTGWAVRDDGRVVACVGVTPATVDGEPGAHLHRLYVAATHRRRGLAAGLVALVEAHAEAAWGARAVELWSDTRFADAHRLYARCGYRRTGETRRLHDPSDTTEYRFVRHLPPGRPTP
jgi:putative acetyltransferase